MVTKTKRKPPKIKKLKKEAKSKTADLVNEISFDDSPYYQFYQYRPYNPTHLYQKTGSLDIYDDMRRDEQVKAVLHFKKYAAINSGWKITMPESEEGADDSKDQEIQEFVERNLQEDVRGNFNDKLMEVLTALDYGYSITEKLFELEDGKYYLIDLKTRAPHSFEFHTDDQGNLPADSGLQQLTKDGNLLLPRNKFLIFVYNKEFGNWYGTSDLQSCYRAWFSKDIIIKFMNIYLERFGTPIAWGKYPPGSRSAEITQLKSVLNKFQQRTSVTTPDNMVIELLEATRRGTADYKGAIELYNMMIARSMLMPDLLGLSKGIEGGAYALGQTHLDMFFMVLNKIRCDIEEVIGDQLIKQLVDLNFETDKYPQFKFKPINEDNKQELAKIWIEAVKTGAVKPSLDDENHLRDMVSFPKSVDQDQPANPNMPPPSPEDQMPESETGVLMPDEDSEKQDYSSVKRFNFDKRVNFKRIDREMREVEVELEQEISSVLNLTFNDLVDQIIKKKVIENKDFKKVETIQPKYMGEIRAKLKQGLRDIYKAGRREAKEELESVRKFKAPEELTGGEAKKLIDAKSFAITGDLKSKIKKDIRWIIFNGIEAGDSTKTITGNINRLKVDRYIPDRNREGDKINKAAYIEMVTRTAITDAFNQGRKSFFESKNVRPIMRAYKYSAILDDVTSPVCIDLDSKVYGVDDPIWSDITPPNHPNCRSVLIPLTKFDNYNLTKVRPGLVPMGNPGDKFWGK